MKQFRFLFLLLFSVTVFSQGIIPQGNATSVVVNPGGYKSAKWTWAQVGNTTEATPNFSTAGMFRFNPNTGNFQYNNGAVWIDLLTSSNVGAAILTSTITNGDTDHAPTGDAVFDALALKANDNAVVHLTGNEGPITGQKSFTSSTSNPSLSFTNSATGTAIIIVNSGSAGSTGMNVTNSSGAAGINVNNTSSVTGSRGIQVTNNTNNGISLNTSGSTSVGISGAFSGTSKGIVLNDGTLFTGQYLNFGTNKFIVDYLGNTTGLSFIKTGGTSSQFLKADGSVDTNVYVTSSILTPTITNGDTTHAPNGDAVFDALALKANLSGGNNFTGTQNVSGTVNATKIGVNGGSTYDLDVTGVSRTKRTGVNGAGVAIVTIIGSDAKTVGDAPGFIFQALNSSDADASYASIIAKIVSNTTGAQSGSMSLRTMNAGSTVEALVLDPDGKASFIGRASGANAVNNNDYVPLGQMNTAIANRIMERPDADTSVRTNTQLNAAYPTAPARTFIPAPNTMISGTPAPVIYYKTEAGTWVNFPGAFCAP